MESSPFHHRRRPFLSDQPLSLPNPTTAIEVTSGLSNQASTHNKLQSSDSCILMAVHDRHRVEKTNMPTTKSSSFKHHQSNETKSCRKWKKEKRSNNDEENNKKKMRDVKEEGQIGYIHVRARRGEATDSHSLAERVRREKISEKMKALQAIVPGCDKITGKALMLDEVINYVQSLQNEIEVLCSKLASVSPMSHELGADFDAFMFKQYQNMTSNQQQMPSFQAHQMASMVSQNNYGEIVWNLDEQVQRQELDDPFAIINTFDSYY